MAFTLSEAQFKCTICLDIYNNPTSIPCGHNFCLECINHLWDTKPKAQCPLCKEEFKILPELRINVGLKDITEQFKRSVKVKPVAARRSSMKQLSSDETHLTPHLGNPTKVKDALTLPPNFGTRHLCKKHNKPLEMFCRKDQTLVCMACRENDHKHHDIVPIEEESKKIKTLMKKTDSEFQQMIQARVKKTEEIMRAVELSKMNKERELQSSIQVVSRVVTTIEKNQAFLVDELEQKEEANERKANEHLDKLGKEISELQRRRGELQHLERSEDLLHLLQSFPSLSTPLPTRDWSQVRVHSNIYLGKVRKAFSNLVDICRELEKKLSEEEVSEIKKYAVDITLDPVTAAGWLVLSPDGKKVSLGFQQRRLSLPDDPRRFDSCVSVLGKESFTSGKHYWVVEVGDKTDWDLGVAKESIVRKGPITVRPDNGYWAICRRKGTSLHACAGPSVLLHLHETPQKVGIFLDYEEGSVSFYNTEAKTHIYTYGGCEFTEPLYPYLNPCLHDNGKNTAPLIICPVDFMV